jgi:DNA-binding SARP family transcriptional activator
MTQLSGPRHAARVPGRLIDAWQPPSMSGASRGSRLLAALSLIALVVGVPSALALSVGWPLPGSFSALRGVGSTLTSPLAPSLVIDVLALIAWGAWAHFTCCVLAELATAARAATSGRTGPPLQVPCGGPAQKLARRLVQAAFATAVATSVGVATFSGTILTSARPALAAGAAAALPASAAAHEDTVQVLATATGSATDAASQPHAPTHTEYIVQPPEGGYYDSLWDIAERLLGDGQRWREIYELNEGREQPDGRALTRPDLIRPGWGLLLPGDAMQVTAGGGSAAPEGRAGRASAPDPVTSTPDVGPALRSEAEPPLASPPRVELSPQPARPAVPRTPEARGPVTSASASPEFCGPDDDLELSHEDDGVGTPVAVPVLGSLLAAAALAALAARRRRQRRRRASGQSIPLPEASAAQAEGRLRVLADPAELTLVDEALRALSVVVRDTGVPIPDVRRGSLRAAHLDLIVATPVTHVPAPFVAVPEGSGWRASRAASPLVPPEQADHVLPLLPLLLTVVRDPAGSVLLDLEALGSLAVEGQGAEVLGLLTHLAAEAALAPWTEDVEILLVGFDPEIGESLKSLAPERVTVLAELDASMSRALERRVDRVKAAGDRLASRIHGGPAGTGDEVRPPLLILCSAPPSPVLSEQLALLVPEVGRGALAVVAPAPWEAARTTWLLGGPLPGDEARHRSGLTPCQLDAERLAALADLLQVARHSPAVRVHPVEVPAPQTASSTAAAEPGGRTSPPSEVSRHAADAEVVPVAGGVARGSELEQPRRDALDSAVEAYLAGTAPVRVSLLGPVTVHAEGNIDPDRRSRLTEVVAYLATHRRGVPVADFDAAIWPDRQVPLTTRNQAITRTRAWLGSDDDGVSWLRPIAGGRLRLSERVLVDWELFQALRKRASEPGRQPNAARRDLETAMRLVRGRTLAALPTGRYGWLTETYLEQEIPSAIIDVAHALARLLLEAGESAGAIDVARLALEVDRYDERPWRDLLEAHHLRGEPRQVAVLVDQLLQLLDVEVDDELQPETAELVERLLPRRRPA